MFVATVSNNSKLRKVKAKTVVFGHTACNHRPSAEPKRYVCGYSLKQQQAQESQGQDCGIWTRKDVDNLAAEEAAVRPGIIPFIPILGRERGEAGVTGGRKDDY